MQERVNLTFPSPIDAKTKSYTQSVLQNNRRRRPDMLVLPVDRVHSMLKSEVLQNNNLDRDVTRYLMAILEYISMEILKVRAKHIFM